MENIKLGVLSSVIAIICLIAGVFMGTVFNGPVQPVSLGGLIHNVQESFDEGIAVDGTEIISGTGALTITAETNIDTLVQGGDVTVVTAGTTTITAANMCDSIILQHDSDGSNCPVTTPTAALLIADCIPTAGDSFEFYYENTGGEHDTITAGANIELLEPSGGDVIIEDTEWAHFLVVNEDGTSVTIVVSSLQNAD